MISSKLIDFWRDFFAWQTIPEFISNILMIICVICGLIGWLVTPVIWNFYLIPKIEKRVKSKLKLSPWLNFMLFDFWFCPQFEVMQVIVLKYLALKRGKDPEQIRCFRGSKKRFFWLASSGYDVSKATKLEVFMAFFTLMIFLMVPLGIAGGMIIIKFFNPS